MPELEVKLPHHAYKIIVKRQCLDGLAEYVKSNWPNVVVISDSTVWQILGQKVEQGFSKTGLKPLYIVQPTGEEEKNLATVSKHYDKLIENSIERGTALVALGGGVLGDTAGFVAASYLRGLPFIQCPTTLLAMVDASVGGKVGVNLKQGKNLVGAFYQPEAVYIDPAVLKTLSVREFRCGLAECVKHAVIQDSELFNWTDKNIERILDQDLDVLEELIFRNVKIKAEIVQADEKENNIRALLNLGHTYAHAIEAILGYGKIGHGEAVALGLIAASRLSTLLGKASNQIEQRIKTLLEKIGLPTNYDLPKSEQLLAAMYADKKVSSGKIRFVLPLDIGKAEICKIQDDDLILESLKSISK